MDELRAPVARYGRILAWLEFGLDQQLSSYQLPESEGRYSLLEIVLGWPRPELIRSSHGAGFEDLA